MHDTPTTLLVADSDAGMRARLADELAQDLPMRDMASPTAHIARGRIRPAELAKPVLTIKGLAL